MYKLVAISKVLLMWRSFDMYKKILYIAFTIILLLIIVGCNNTANEQVNIEPESQRYNDENFNEIEDKVFFAAVEGDYNKVKALLNSDENISVDNCKAAQELGADPHILFSIFPDKIDICKLLIDYGIDVNAIGKGGYSYLHTSIASSEDIPSDDIIKITKYILEKGTDPNIMGKREFNKTPLNYLMEKSPILLHNYDDLYDMLIKYGAKITRETLKTSLDSDSGFIYAQDICRYLKENNLETGISKTLEAILLNESDIEIISLIEKGEYKHKDKKYIVWYAAAMCGPDVLKCLKTKKFNMKAKNKYNMSLLDIAAGYNKSNTVEYLLKQGFDSNDDIEIKAQEDTGDAFQQSAELETYTPISFALVNGKKKNIETLLEAGAEFQRNSWVSAVFSGNVKAVDILTEKNFKQEDCFIFYCYMYGSDEMVKHLLNKGVSYDVSDYGQTLIEFLYDKGDDDRADLILKYGVKKNI